MSNEQRKCNSYFRQKGSGLRVETYLNSPSSLKSLIDRLLLNKEMRKRYDIRAKAKARLPLLLS